MGCWSSKPNPHMDPTAVRGCTDVFWLFLYVAFWFVMIVVAAFAFVYGNPLRLLNGYDSFGNTCGIRNNVNLSNSPLSGLNNEMKPFLFYLDVYELSKTIKVCVKQCPDRTIKSARELYTFYKDTDSNLCRYDFDLSIFKDEKLNKTVDNHNSIFNFMGPCPKLPIYESEVVIHRCVPKPGVELAGGIVGSVYALLNSWGAAEQLLGDLYMSWHYMIGCSILAFVLSIALISILHILTAVISWLILFFAGVACIAATVVLWWTYVEIRKNLDDTPDYKLLTEITRNETAILTFAIISTIITVVILLIIWFLRAKIDGLAALFKEASSCLGQVPGLIGPPLLASLVIVGFFAFWVTVVICLATANYPGVKSLLPLTNNVKEGTKINLNDSVLSPLYKSNTTKPLAYTLVDYVDADWLRYMWWFYVVGLIWTSEFIMACLHMTIAGAVAHWYFRKSTAETSPVCYSIAKLIKYHLGSCALGSLLITTFKIPRLVLTYIYTKLKHNELTSPCAQCTLKCGICCFWALEKFIRYLNHNAYVVIAIENCNFCTAAAVAWNAIMSNAAQVATINGIGDFILFLGKVAIAAVCGTVSLCLLKDNPDIHFFAAPVLLTVIFSFLIAHCILSLYEIVVDTLFLCVCEDRTLNGDSGRWKDSGLASLVGGISTLESAQGDPMELSPIQKTEVDAM